MQPQFDLTPFKRPVRNSSDLYLFQVCSWQRWRKLRKSDQWTHIHTHVLLTWYFSQLLKDTNPGTKPQHSDLPIYACCYFKNPPAMQKITSHRVCLHNLCNDLETPFEKQHLNKKHTSQDDLVS